MTTVKYFNSTMTGAPALSNVAGNRITLLDACLVNGFGSVTLDSLVVASNVATGTYSAGHGFAMVGNTGPVITIGGATPSGLNGEWRIASVPTTSTFTFATAGITDQTATGTITAKRSPAGFEKAFSGTNKAAYRSLNEAGTRLYLRFDDDYTTYARIRGYEIMSNVDTGTGPFPTDAQMSGGGYLFAANGTNRAWSLFSDGRMVYLFCDTNGNASYWGGSVFGDIDSYAAVDSYACALIYVTSSSSSLNNLYAINTTTGSVLARSYTQLGSSILSARYSHGKTSGLGSGGQAYPAPVDNSIHLWPVECWESTTLARGLMPGLWNPVHSASSPHGTVVTDIENLPGRTLLVHSINAANYLCAIDLTGPWR